MNRNRLLDAFISNLANAVVHKVLEKAIDKPEIKSTMDFRALDVQGT